MVAVEAEGGRDPHGQRVGRDGRPLRAAGLVRVSTGKQGDGYSPGLQRAAILAQAQRDGYLIDECDVHEDRESGHVLERKGYQAVLKAVREGVYAAIYVYALDRFGRDSVERQLRGRELDRLHVALVSVTEGEDQAGLLRVIRAEMAELESRRNAERVTPARVRAAQQGWHVGMTPYGYQRRYPEHGAGRQPIGALVPLEPEASIVRELFERYASGQWSTRDLAEDLNRRGVPGPRPRRKEEGPTAWTTSAVSRLLRNVSYAGLITYNRTPQGRFVQAEPGTAFTVEGRHAPLVDPDVFALVQKRLNDGRTYERVRNGHVERLITRAAGQRPLLTGLLRCHLCGGPMAALPPREGRSGELRCQRRANGENCTAQSYRLEIAEEALLREIGRLHGSPWSASGEQALAGPNAGSAARLAAELEAVRARLARAQSRYTEEIDEPTPAERAAFQARRAALNAQIAHLEQQLAEVSGSAAALPRLRKLHSTLRALSPAKAAQQLTEQGDQVGLRDLVVLLVESATLVERWPERRSTWLRFRVVWQPDVQQLLAAGLLYLTPPEEAPGR